jgi:hypothetical protein
MPEVMFVLKSLIVTVVLMICLQIKIGNTSIEESLHQWIQTSSISNYVHGVSSGAVLAIRNAAQTTKNFVGETFGHDSGTQKAGRLNFEFKRSQKYQDEHADR